MATVSYDDLTLVNPMAYSYCTFASDIGISPAMWAPHTLEAPSIGNGQPLIRLRRQSGEQAVYRQQFGVVEVTVFNE